MIARYTDPPLFLTNVNDYEHDIIGSISIIFLVGFSEIPFVGPFLGILAATIISFLNDFLTHPEDLWDALRAQIEAMIDQKIAENDFQLAKDKLIGLNLVLLDYCHAFSTHNPETVKSTLISAHVAFDAAYGIFSDESRKVTLLPLFVHFALLHLTVLRDAVQNPGYTGLADEADLAFYKSTLAQRVQTYCDHIDQTYGKVRAQVLQEAQQYENDHDNWQGYKQNVSYLLLLQPL
ncbi:MAG: insecticidal delta-endotoxin Cry8Ea1 family protein [Enterobacteriaceae bacterium]